MKIGSPIAAALCLAALSPAAPAQVDRATVNGTVRDAAGAVIAGARVAITSAATGLAREKVTNQDGFFALPALPVGAYRERVERDGFAAADFESLMLRTGETRGLDVTLQVGAVDNIVEVSESAAPPADRSSFTVGTVIKNEQVEGLPLNGRHWASLLVLAPGAVNTGSGNQNTVRFNGRGRDENNLTLDGLDQTGVKDPRQLRQRAAQRRARTEPGAVRPRGLQGDPADREPPARSPPQRL